MMKVTEIKEELEKVSKYIPDLRKDLDEYYASDSSGKKSRLKKLWKEYEDQYKDVINSKEYRILH